jgi:uncharacterized protein (TIGR02271 family)
MTEQTIVAVYDTTADAETTIRDLEAAGIAPEAIESHAGMATPEPPTERFETTEHEGGGFLDWLFGDDTPDHDRAVYRDSLDRGGRVVSVRTSEEDYDQVIAILERNNPVNVDERGASLGYAAPAASLAPASTSTVAPERRMSDEDAGKIQLTEEQLDVGKRTVQGGRVRVRSRVVETPVSENVSLREERVTLERRAPTGATTPGADPFAEKTIELTETREEPVIAKTARVVEEVVLGKDVRERTETVRDTVRRQEVDVEHVDADGKPSAEPTAVGKPLP